MAKKAAPKSKNPKNPKGTPMMKRLAVPLTEEELAKKSEAGANFDGVILEQELQFAVVKKDWNNKIGDLKQKRSAALLAVREKVEEREVEVIMVKNFELNRIEYWYEGQMLDRREMSADDRQEDMFTEEAKPGKTKRRSFKDAAALVRDTAEARDMNNNIAADIMTPGFKPKVVKPVDHTQSATERDQEIAEVHAAETGRKTKRSSVDRVDTH